MTKTEQKILEHVRYCNSRGALAGVSIAEERFAKRLASAGKLVYVNWTHELGSGWAIADHPLASKSAS